MKYDCICFFSRINHNFIFQLVNYSIVRLHTAKGHNRCCGQYETCLHSYESHYTDGYDCLPIIIQFYYLNIRLVHLCDSIKYAPLL